MTPIIRRNIPSLNPRGTGENGNGIYKPGVEVCRLKGDSPIAFRILPAYPPHARVPGNGLDASGNPAVDLVDERGEVLPPDAWVPFIDEKDQFFEWFADIQVATLVGHGNWKQRKDVVSLLSLPRFDDDGNRERVEDPYWELQQYVRNKASATWGYLQKRTGDFKTGEGPSLPFIQHRYLMNVVRTDQANKVFLGELSATSAINSLNDLVMAPNKHATDEMLAQDYVNAYDNGDITDPANGKVLVIEKDADSGKGSASPYTIKLHSTFDRSTRRTTYTTMDVQARLGDRYDLTDVEGLVKIPTAEEQIKLLCDLLCGRTPDGQFHEYSMMKEAWVLAGHEEWAAMVPEPPIAPGRGSVRGTGPIEETEDDVVESPEPTTAPKPAPGRWNVPGRSSAPAQPAYVSPALEKVAEEANEPQDASVAPVDGSKPVAGVAGEATKPAGSWRDRYKAKFSAPQA